MTGKKRSKRDSPATKARPGGRTGKHGSAKSDQSGSSRVHSKTARPPKVPAAKSERSSQPTRPPATKARNARVDKLHQTAAREIDRELKAAPESLQILIRDLECTNRALETSNEELRKKVEALEVANKDLSNLLANAGNAKLVLNPDNTIRLFTPAAKRLFRLIESDIGRAVSDIKWRFEDPNMLSDIEAVLQSLSPSEREIAREDGHWYMRRIAPYRTVGKHNEGIVMTFTDITTPKEAERLMRDLNVELARRVDARTAELNSERNFATAVLDTAAALVFVVDRGGRIVRWNKACELATGYSAEEINGDTDWWDRVLLPEEREGAQQVSEKLRSGDCPQRHENHLRHRDGSLHLIDWTITCLRDRGGAVEYVVATGLDVTEQRRIQEEARRRAEELAHLHRVYTAGELAAAMAHELNQPLAAIAGLSEAGLQLLQRGRLEPGRITNNLEQIAE